MVRSQRMLVALVAVVLMASGPGPADAVVKRVNRPVLRCRWSGVVHAYDNYEGTVLLEIGEGKGTCDLDGQGGWTITSMRSGIGSNSFIAPSGYLFQMNVAFQVRRDRDGHVRTFDQSWGGLRTLYANFIALGAHSVSEVGAGEARGLPWPDFGVNPTEPFDVQASFEWTFVKTAI